MVAIGQKNPYCRAAKESFLSNYLPIYKIMFPFIFTAYYRIPKSMVKPYKHGFVKMKLKRSHPSVKSKGKETQREYYDLRNHSDIDLIPLMTVYPKSKPTAPIRNID